MRRTNERIRDATAKQAVAARYKSLPLLPDLLTLREWLRDLNIHGDGPGTVWLYCYEAGWPDARWCLDSSPHDWPHAEHSEDMPGDGKPFDATAAARRLLAEARLAGFR
jgi:hypothetical protein